MTFDVTLPIPQSHGEAFNASIRAPQSQYAITCIGPVEEHRAEYVRLRWWLTLCLNWWPLWFFAFYFRAKLARIPVEEKWSEQVHNVVCTAGLTDIVDKYLKGSSYTAAWYLILAGSGTKAAGDTLASHAGWSEVTPYSGNRPAITWGTTSSGSNTSSAVSISITGSATVAGAGLSTVNSGTSGVLYAVADFSASRTVANGDTLNVTPTVSVS